MKKFRRDGKRYNGFVFRLEQQDLPAYFGHFMGATINDKFEKPIKTLYDLGIEMQNTIIWRIGEITLQSTSERLRNDLDYIKLGREELQKRPTLYKETLDDAAIMEYILEDYQIVISKSIESNRIIRVIPPTGEFGRVLYKNKKESYIEG